MRRGRGQESEEDRGRDSLCPLGFSTRDESPGLEALGICWLERRKVPPRILSNSCGTRAELCIHLGSGWNYSAEGQGYLWQRALFLFSQGVALGVTSDAGQTVLTGGDPQLKICVGIVFPLHRSLPRLPLITSPPPGGGGGGRVPSHPLLGNCTTQGRRPTKLV